MLRLPDDPLPEMAAWQAMQLGAGSSLHATTYSPAFVPRGRVLLNTAKQRAWAEGRECIWRTHGVYEMDSNGTPRLLRPDYFAKRPDGGTVNVDADYLFPFWERLLTGLRAVHRADGVPPCVLFSSSKLHASCTAHRALPQRLPFYPHRYMLFGELSIDLNELDQKHHLTKFADATAATPAQRIESIFGKGDVCIAPHWYVLTGLCSNPPHLLWTICFGVILDLPWSHCTPNVGAGTTD